MLNIYKANDEDINEITDLIYRLNSNKESNIGFCDKDKGEIKNSLSELFEDESKSNPFYICKEHGKIIAAIGYDGDIESGVAELWGPFIDVDDYEKWEYISYNLWTELMDYKLNIITYKMFINVNNKKCINFAYDRGFALISEEFILKLYKKDYKIFNEECKTIQCPKEFYNEVIVLHDNIFKNTYYSGEELIKRINENRKIFTVIEENHVVGYIYVEIYREFKDASIEFVGVEEKRRGNRIGINLINEVIRWVFSFDEINEVKLCVNSANKALNLYRKIGFKIIDKLIFLKL